MYGSCPWHVKDPSLSYRKEQGITRTVEDSGPSSVNLLDLKKIAVPFVVFNLMQV